MQSAVQAEGSSGASRGQQQCKQRATSSASGSASRGQRVAGAVDVQWVRSVEHTLHTVVFSNCSQKNILEF